MDFEFLELILAIVLNAANPENLNSVGDIVKGITIVTAFTLLIMLPFILLWEYLLIVILLATACLTIFPIVLIVLYWDNFPEDFRTFTSNAWIGGVIFTALVSLYLFRQLWYKTIQSIFYCLNCRHCGSACENCKECGGRCCKECFEKCGYGLNQVCIEISKCCCRCGRDKSRAKIVAFEDNNNTYNPPVYPNPSLSYSSPPSTKPEPPYELPSINRNTVIFESTDSDDLPAINRLTIIFESTYNK